jgi:hypothetical protein
MHLEVNITFVWSYSLVLLRCLVIIVFLGVGGGWVDGLSPDTKDSTPELEDVEDMTMTVVSPVGRSKTKK